MRAGMEVVDGIHVGQSPGDWLYVRRCRSTSRLRGDTPMTLYHTAIQVRSSGWCRVGSGPSYGEGLSNGRHDKVPVRCPCSRLAARHGSPRTPLLIVQAPEDDPQKP